MAAKIVSRLEQREVVVGETDIELEGQRKTYADMVRAKTERKPKVTGIRGQPARTRNEVIVSLNGKDVEEIKKEIKNAMNPREMGIHVKQVLKVKRGVVIEVRDKEEVLKIKNSQSMKDKGFKVEVGKKKNPIVMIYGYDSSIPEDEVLVDIYERNVGTDVMFREEYLENIVVKHRHRSRQAVERSRNKELGNWVLREGKKLFSKERKDLCGMG